MPCTGKRQEPREAVVKSQWGAGKIERSKGMFLECCLSDIGLCRLSLPMGRHGNAMSCIAKRVINSIQFAHMCHHVEGKIERAAPGIFDLHILQLRVDLDHFPAQDLCAALDRVRCFREEGRPRRQRSCGYPTGGNSSGNACSRRSYDFLGINSWPVHRQFFGGNNE